MNKKEAIILAGGLGTRLREKVPDLPKSMAPIGGKPFLSHLVNYLLKAGIDRYIFSLGYMHEVIEEYLRGNYPDLDADFSIESEPLGTGGGIQLACQKLRNKKNIFIFNGDTFFEVKLEELERFQLRTGADCVLALKPMKQFSRYGTVELGEGGRIIRFNEKKFCDEGLINGGVYLLNVEHFLELGLPSKFSFEKDYLEKFASNGHIFGLVQDRYFIDIGIPEDFEKADLDFSGLK